MAFIFHLLNKLMFFFSLPRFESWDNHHNNITMCANFASFRINLSS
jgi:hypothetical protein